MFSFSEGPPVFLSGSARLAVLRNTPLPVLAIATPGDEPAGYCGGAEAETAAEEVDVEELREFKCAADGCDEPEEEYG